MANAAESSPGGSTTGTTSSPYLRAKSRSRWSCARTAEDRAGAVFHQHEIGDPHREGHVLQERVPHPQPGVVALLLRRFDHRLATCPCGGIRRRTRRPSGRAPPPRPTADAPARAPGTTCRTACRDAWYRPRRPRCRAVGLPSSSEGQPRALAAADPLRLHQPHALGPAIQRIERVQQFLRIVGDLQEPLAELLLLHQRAGPPAAAVDHLLVRQHGAIDRVPVDPALLALHQAGAQEIQEQLLLMAVIFADRRWRTRAPIRATAP